MTLDERLQVQHLASGEAILVMCGDRSVSVMMQNVTDVVNGVLELLADRPAPCPALPRR